MTSSFLECVLAAEENIEDEQYATPYDLIRGVHNFNSSLGRYEIA